MIKRTIIAIVIFIIIYFCINFAYNKIINSKEYICVYAPNKDITRGKNILREDVYRIKINKKDFKEEFNFDERWFSEDFVLTKDLEKDQIITRDKLIKKEDYVFDATKEMLGIPLQNDSKYIRAKLEKGTVINIYYIDNITNKVETIEENIKIVPIPGACAFVNSLILY